MASIRTTTQGSTRYIILDAVKRRNALDAALATALLAAVQTANADPEVGVIVFRSAMRSGFSVGPDLQALQACAGSTAKQDELDKIVQTLNAIILAIYASPKITIVAFHGYALGGGLNLFLACDIRLSVATTRFVESFLYLGVTPDLSSSYFLPRLLGVTRAMDLLLSGRMFTAEEAAHWGLLTEVVPRRSDLDLHINALCERFGASDPKKVAVLKRLMHAAERTELAVHLDDERAELMRCVEAPEVCHRIAHVVSSPFSKGAAA